MSRWWLAPLSMAFSVAHLALWGQVMLTPTIDLVKLEWTAWAGLGVVYSSWFLLDVLTGDVVAVRETDGDWRRRKTVELFILFGAFLLGMHLLLATIGIDSMTHALPAQVPTADLVAQLFLVASGQGLVLLLVRISQIRNQLREVT